MSEDFEREERAFAEALRKDAPVESFRPLDAEAIKAAARPARSGRTRWLKGMAAAAAVVVAVGIGVVMLPRMAASVPATASATPETVPSPPTATISFAPASMAPLTISRISSLFLRTTCSTWRPLRPASISFLR